ncbi:MAG TPA: DUF2911 domain-containing protein [Parasegetibacter sp.]|jgi:hypothetical protein
MKPLLKIFTTLLFSIGIMTISSEVSAQQDKSQRPSPPATVSEKVNGATITIEYSRPSVKGRKIWGALVPYDKVWRTGANEATTFSTDKDIKVEGQTLAAGTYGLFTIPGEEEWTIIFNKTAKQWGAYNYNSDDDVLRVKVKPGKAEKKYEQFTIEVSNSGVVSLMWDELRVNFNLK